MNGKLLSTKAKLIWLAVLAVVGYGVYAYYSQGLNERAFRQCQMRHGDSAPECRDEWNAYLKTEYQR